MSMRDNLQPKCCGYFYSGQGEKRSWGEDLASGSHGWLCSFPVTAVATPWCPLAWDCVTPISAPVLTWPLPLCLRVRLPASLLSGRLSLPIGPTREMEEDLTSRCLGESHLRRPLL